MQLRSGYVLGQGQLQPEAKPHFEEGLGLVFARWTALCLAVENEWGGSSSRTKADELMEDVLHWFYRQRGVDACACGSPRSLVDGLACRPLRR
jgi:pre-rRNA-processing protein TSR2